jgi:hypothetical protein
MKNSDLLFTSFSSKANINILKDHYRCPPKKKKPDHIHGQASLLSFHLVILSRKKTMNFLGFRRSRIVSYNSPTSKPGFPHNNQYYHCPYR